MTMFPTIETAGVVTKTLGDLVRAAALRRGGRWAAAANQYARQAEAKYGTRPLRGDDLQTVFDDVLGTREQAKCG
ncbi:hypothetical protein [Burkholderia ubonensis]|uniref:hypothetical protein n=1 Tax=Burkholderia ubonensis TaxID=101571 RepID=UPI000B329634|nr:hypothetical protein [Burkholderia ubonensis]